MVGMQAPSGEHPCALLDLLKNTLVLRYISPYLGICGLVSLSATSKAFQGLVNGTPGVFQYVDLSKLNVPYGLPKPSADFDHDLLEIGRMSDTTDEFNARPLRRIFDSLKRRHVLQDVRILILDGLSVPASILWDTLCNYDVRILSLINVRDLGDEKLMQILRYLIRSNRPEGTPKLKGLYYFVQDEASSQYPTQSFRRGESQPGITNVRGAQLGSGIHANGNLIQSIFVDHFKISNSLWLRGIGQVQCLDPDIDLQWARLIQACEGLIAFDVVLCRHNFARRSNNRAHDESHELLEDVPSLATVSLAACEGYQSCPEAPARLEDYAENEVPMLAPAPMHHASVKSAQQLYTYASPHSRFIARCKACLKDRWCEMCNVWWCESVHHTLLLCSKD